MYTNVGIYFDLGCGVFGFLSFCFGPAEGLGYVGIHRWEVDKEPAFWWLNKVRVYCHSL